MVVDRSRSRRSRDRSGTGSISLPLLDRRVRAARPGPRGSRRRRADPARPLRHPRRLLRGRRWRCGCRRPGSAALGRRRRGRRARSSRRSSRPRRSAVAGGRRVPPLPAPRRRAPLGDDGRDVRRFVIQSTIASSLTSLRGVARHDADRIARAVPQAGYFRNAQAPLTGVRRAQLARAARAARRADRGLRARATATRVLAAAAPLHRRHDARDGRRRARSGGPDAVADAASSTRDEFRVHATDAARLVLLVGALQLVFGWTKTLPVTIGRPGLRILTHGIEVAVFVPAAARLRVALGRDGRRGRAARLDRRVLRASGRSCSRGCGTTSAPWRRREGPRRLRDLAARRRRPREPRARGRRVPARARPRAARPRHRRRAARARGRIPSTGSRARAARASATLARSAASARGPRAPTSSTRPGCSAAAALGSLPRAARTSLKLTADPAFERARRRGLFDGIARGVPDERGARDAAVPARARRDRAPCGTRRLSELVPRASSPSAGVWRPSASTCCRTLRPTSPASPPRDECARRHGFDGPTLVFGGRLTEQKSLELAIEAARRAGVGS